MKTEPKSNVVEFQWYKVIDTSAVQACSQSASHGQSPAVEVSIVPLSVQFLYYFSFLSPTTFIL